ncbi:MAG TPA: acyl transferase [Bacteroidetes bacterium]|nr:acyl transferase [Bacteroidota bacterium]
MNKEVILQLFRKQASQPGVYKDFIEHLGIDIDNVKKVEAIPFMPVQFFKNHAIHPAGITSFDKVFESSGTSQSTTSKHYIPNLTHHKDQCEQIFKECFGALDQYYFFSYLPSYYANSNSSLLHMVEYFMEAAHQKKHHYDDLNMLNTDVEKVLHENAKQPFIVGVTYALLDWAEQNPINLRHSILVETGGMKGRRAPMHREELHKKLRNAFSINSVFSEYGMTECMGQAWSKDGHGNFEVNSQFQVFVRPINQLYTHANLGQRGVIQIIDLGNDKSCGVSFLETEDIGEMINDRCFKVHGRADGSEARGCNLMMEE